MSDDATHFGATHRVGSSRWLALRTTIVCLVPALALANGVVAARMGWHFGRLDWAVVVTATIALVFMFIVVASRRGRSFAREHAESVVHGLLSVLAAWLAAEAMVAAFFWHASGGTSLSSSSSFHLHPANAHFVQKPGAKTFPGIVGISNFTTNSNGLRGPEWPPRDSAYRILSVGGSTTECSYLDDTETWQHQVMQRLNKDQKRKQVWVGSAGRGGFPTIYHLKFIKESPLVREVDALILLIGANDFNQFLRGNLEDDVFFFEGRGKPVWRYSPIHYFVLDRWRNRRSAIQVDDPQGEHYALRRMMRQTSRIRRDLPEGLGRAVQQYEARVAEIVQFARGHGIRPLFVTQPTLWDENLSERGRALLWLGDISGGEYLSVEMGRVGIDEHNEALRRVCNRMAVECIDTASMHGNERYFYDDFHFTEAGAAELARLIAEHLLDHSGVDGRERSG